MINWLLKRLLGRAYFRLEVSSVPFGKRIGELPLLGSHDLYLLLSVGLGAGCAFAGYWHVT